MPRAPVVRVRLLRGEDVVVGWENWLFLFVSRPVPADPAWQTEPTPFPAWFAAAPPPLFRVEQLWLQRAWREGSPIAAERRWHPEWGTRNILAGVELFHTADHIEGALSGFHLIDARERHRPPGRPKRRATDVPDEKRRDIARRARDLREQGTQWRIVSDDVGYPENTLRRWIEWLEEEEGRSGP